MNKRNKDIKELIFLYDEYASADDSKLTFDALKLKYTILDLLDHNKKAGKQ